MAIFIYLLQVSLYTTLMWGIYCAVWRNRPMLRAGRTYLLSCLILPLFLPFIRIPLSPQSAIAAYYVALPEVTIGKASGAQAHGHFDWISAGLIVYAIGAAVVLLMYALTYTAIIRRVRKAERIMRDGQAVYVGTGIGPATLWRTVFFPDAHIQPDILRHELAHIKLLHRYDTLLVQVLHILFWASPAHWLIGRELKMVHEFEADHNATQGSDTDTYTELLLAETFGTSLPLSIAHSFFHNPLKRRIMMLQQKTAIVRLRNPLMKTLALTGCLLLGCLLIQCKRADNDKPRKLNNSLVTKGSWYEDTTMYDQFGKPYKTVNTTERVYETVEEMPQFNGDINEYLAKNLHYPEAARKAGKEGRVVLKFIIGDHGQVGFAQIVKSSGVDALDAEAMRVVSAMPAWKPGRHQGHPASVFLTLPISFKLG